jgi:hypothetical protein
MWIEYESRSLCISLLYRSNKSKDNPPAIVVSDMSKYYEEYILKLICLKQSVGCTCLTKKNKHTMKATIDDTLCKQCI